MKIRNPFLTKAAGLLGASLVRCWMSTVEYKGVYFDPAVDPVYPAHFGRRIFVFWHEYILSLLYLRGHSNSDFLVSQHGDAEILSRMAYYLGFGCIRGSTGKTGAAALRELTADGGLRNIAITPDGPLGPRRQLAIGPLYVAGRLQLPIVPIGIGFDRPWRLNTWDNFAIPRPGSRGRLVVGPAISPPPRKLDRQQLEESRRRVEAVLNRLTFEAEAWAEQGTAKVGEVPIRRQPAPPRRSTVESPRLWTPSRRAA